MTVLAITLIVLGIVISAFVGLFMLTKEFQEESVEKVETAQELRQIEHLQQYFTNSLSGSDVISTARRVNAEGLPVIINTGDASNLLQFGDQLTNVVVRSDFYTAVKGTTPSSNIKYLSDNLGILTTADHPYKLNLKHHFRSIPIMDSENTTEVIGVVFEILP